MQLKQRQRITRTKQDVCYPSSMRRNNILGISEYLYLVFNCQFIRIYHFEIKIR